MSFSLKRVCSLPYQTMHCSVSKNVPKTVSKYIFNMYFSHYQHKRAISLTPIELGLNLFGKTALRVVEACSQQRNPGHPESSQVFGKISWVCEVRDLVNPRLSEGFNQLAVRLFWSRSQVSIIRSKDQGSRIKVQGLRSKDQGSKKPRLDVGFLV